MNLCKLIATRGSHKSALSCDMVSVQKSESTCVQASLGNHQVVVIEWWSLVTTGHSAIRFQILHPALYIFRNLLAGIGSKLLVSVLSMFQWPTL